MKHIFFITLLLLLLASPAAFSCKNPIQAEPEPDYTFSVDVLPVKTSIKKGETVSLSFLIIYMPYPDAAYTFRYFQALGNGTLSDGKGAAKDANQFYKVPTDGKLNLLYTSDCEEAQQLDFVFADRFGNRVERTVSLNADYGPGKIFCVEMLPVRNVLQPWVSVDLDFTIVCKEKYEGATFKFRYFFPVGDGLLTDEKENYIFENRYYDIPENGKLKLRFRCYTYTHQQLEFTFEDALGHRVPYKAEFNTPE